MQIKEIKTGPERRIVTAMIVDVSVLAKIAPRWDKEGLMVSPWANLVGAWCVEYYEKYGKAPGKNIEGLYQSWADGVNDKDLKGLVEDYLDELSEDYKSLKKHSQSDYILDSANQFFNEVKAKKLCSAIEGDIDSGKLKKALKRIEQFTNLEVASDDVCDVLQDLDNYKDALKAKDETLIKYTGALGKFFGNTMCRDAFVAFQASEKKGKSFQLIDAACRAVEQGRRVIYFQIGDMSKAQMHKRFAARYSKRPVYATTPDNPVRIPVSIEKSLADESVVVNFEEDKHYTKDLSFKRIKKSIKALVRKKEFMDSRFKLTCHPNNSIGIGGIKSILQTQARRHDWVPDVIVVDYADLIMPEGGVDGRDGINNVWKGLRALSQIYHCLVLTATQADAQSYGASLQELKHFSEDKRKYAHVTAMIGINQTDIEKVNQVLRYNYLVLREAEFVTTNVVYVAGCKAICNPTMVSCF